VIPAAAGLAFLISPGSPAAARLARHHQRRELIPPADGRQNLDPHIARMTMEHTRPPGR
jgi:hypothetical protein